MDLIGRVNAQQGLRFVPGRSSRDAASVLHAERHQSGYGMTARDGREKS
jgi:hypothetical protein